MNELDAKTLISPATTPGSTADEERFLVPNTSTNSPASSKSRWKWRYILPYAIIIASLLEIFVYFLRSDDIKELLCYDPNKQNQAWRFLTYMLVHDSAYHLVLNVFIQFLFAMLLEESQGSLRVGALYLGGGAMGALGATCVCPDLVIGASAGVYALLISHVSHILLNFHTIKYKLYRCVAVGVIVMSDVSYNFIHVNYLKGIPTISWGAHASGAPTGFLLGLVLYKDTTECAKTINKTLLCTGFVLFIVLLTSLVLLNLQIKKCTPVSLLRIKYTYFC